MRLGEGTSPPPMNVDTDLLDNPRMRGCWPATRLVRERTKTPSSLASLAREPETSVLVAENEMPMPQAHRHTQSTTFWTVHCRVLLFTAS